MFNNYNIPNVFLDEERAIYFSIVGENKVHDLPLHVSIYVESAAPCEEAYNCM